ncbi:MAG: S46 family peptidase [Bacteroidota bacterium]
MKKLAIILIALCLGQGVRADEGMWLLMHLKKLNYEDMQKKGLKLTPEDIYDINKPGLKDAVVSLGGFCTGEIISNEGLMLTNHHCAFDAVQSFSSVEHDYLTDGFWAKNKSEEMNVPGLYCQFLVRMENVTSDVLAAIGDITTGPERQAAAQKKMSELRKKAIEGTTYKAEVKPFFDGNEYYLFVYEVFTDIRLVGVPPSSIGKFGGDTDNWMWPRHTGDFALLRVYAGTDNKPAAYSPSNVPYKPKHFLPVSLKGVNKDDYAMIMGYPGSTDRFLTSWGVKQAIDFEQPARVKVRQTRLEIMKKDMDASDAIRIQYASHYAQISNYWKYFIGQTRGLKRLHVYERKKAEEEAFAAWVNGNDDRKKLYGNVLNDISTAFATTDKTVLADVYFQECVFGIEIFTLFTKYFPLYGALKGKTKDQATLAAVVESAKPEMEEYFKNHNAATDTKLMAAMLELYYNDIDTAYRPKELTAIHKKNKGDFKKFAEKYYAKSVFTDKTRLENFLKKPALEGIEKDPGFALMLGFINKYRDYSEKTEAVNNQLNDAIRLYVDGVRKMNTAKKYYPNANFTMRLTYGTVQDYYPQDGMHYLYYTTLDGIMEKEDPKNEEFIVPAKLKELWEKKDYGQYGENGVMKVGFITNNDITGGNSGSPVINANGELIGCAFDGNWESMSGDIAFENSLQRTIVVDIRYVLFVIDKFAGAKHLVDEMKLVK